MGKPAIPLLTDLVSHRNCLDRVLPLASGTSPSLRTRDFVQVFRPGRHPAWGRSGAEDQHFPRKGRDKALGFDAGDIESVLKSNETRSGPWSKSLWLVWSPADPVCELSVRERVNRGTAGDEVTGLRSFGEPVAEPARDASPPLRQDVRGAEQSAGWRCPLCTLHKVKVPYLGQGTLPTCFRVSQ